MDFTFDPKQYGEVVADLVDLDRLCELGPGKPNQSAYSALSALKVDDIFDGKDIHDSMAAQCCLSALWLYHDFLDESHTISQSIPNADGSYWHGIMHRREPDYSNSKYWFRKVGQHEIFDSLLKKTASLLKQHEAENGLGHLVKRSDWDAFAFVDACESAFRQKNEVETLCKKIQQIEWQILFDHCFNKVVNS